MISKYFPDLSAQQLLQFSQLREMYLFWNEKINLISRKDIENLEEKHLLHSLAIAKVISFKPGTRILDIGTGGGFPGIALAIMFPGSQFHLVDSIGKKIFVVKEIILSLGLKNAIAEQMRVEELKQKYDYAVCRAVAPVPEILKWMKGKINQPAIGTLQSGSNYLPNGLLCLKGGDLSEEIKHITLPLKIFNLSGFFEEEFFQTKKLIWVDINQSQSKNQFNHGLRKMPE